MKVLLDTDVLIDFEKGVEDLPEEECYVSIISVYEFIRGRKDYSHAKKLLEELAGIAPLDNNVILKATEIWRELTRRGEKIDDRDLLIGASAIALNMHLYTRNRKHYSRLQKYGLKLYRKRRS